MVEDFRDTVAGQRREGAAELVLGEEGGGGGGPLTVTDGTTTVEATTLEVAPGALTEPSPGTALLGGAVVVLGPYTITHATPSGTEFGVIPAGVLVLDVFGFITEDWGFTIPFMQVELGKEGSFSRVQKFVVNEGDTNDPGSPYWFAIENQEGLPNELQPTIQRANEDCVFRVIYGDSSTTGSMDIYAVVVALPA